MSLRIDKYIANLGLATRRTAPHKIKDQEFLLNGELVKKNDQRVNYGDVLTYSWCDIVIKEFIYVLLHKPAGYVCSDIPDGGWPSYRDLLADCPYVEMLHVAGRLDQDTEGLVIATNDGPWMHRIISPKHKWDKQYLVHLRDPLSEDNAQIVRAGMQLEDGYQTLPAQLEFIDPQKISLTIHEGKYHQIKRMFALLDNEVIYLKREKIWPYTLDGLESGEWREIFLEN